MFGRLAWPNLADRVWPDEGLGLLPGLAIATPVNAAPVSAVLTNSRRVTLRDMRRMLMRMRSKDNAIPLMAFPPCPKILRQCGFGLPPDVRRWLCPAVAMPSTFGLCPWS